MIRELRAERGIAAGELASRADLNRYSIRRIEAESWNPTLERIDRVCAALDISLARLAARAQGLEASGWTDRLRRDPLQGRELRLAIGMAVSEARERRRIKVKDLARAADLDRAHLSKIKNGRGNPSWGTLARISAALEVPLADLLARVERLAQVERLDRPSKG